MRTLKRLALAAAMVAALTVVGTAWAQQQVAHTVISVPSMDCDGCAKNIGGEVAKIRGIAKVEYSVQARTLAVYPLPKTVLSPRALWEAVEKADHQPSKLQGPSGTFTAKPKS